MSLLCPRCLDPQKHTQTWAELVCLQTVIHRSTFSPEIFLARCVYIHANAIGYTQSLYDEACILYSCVVPLCNHRGKEKSTYTIYDSNPTAVAGGHWFQLGMSINKWSLTSLPSRSYAKTFPISKMPLQADAKNRNEERLNAKWQWLWIRISDPETAMAYI